MSHLKCLVITYSQVPKKAEIKGLYLYLNCILIIFENFVAKAQTKILGYWLSVITRMVKNARKPSFIDIKYFK